MSLMVLNTLADYANSKYSAQTSDKEWAILITHLQIQQNLSKA